MHGTFILNYYPPPPLIPCQISVGTKRLQASREIIRTYIIHHPDKHSELSIVRKYCLYKDEMVIMMMKKQVETKSILAKRRTFWR